MREILFKAKRIDNGEWVEGFYQFSDWIYPTTGELAERKYYIRPIRSQDAYEVNPDTICQYTGLADKNGNKIWENDIIRHYNKSWEPNVYTEGIIKWNTFECRFENCSIKNPCNTYTINPTCNYEVIGNIFDNAG